jgi:hypothetical protein
VSEVLLRTSESTSNIHPTLYLVVRHLLTRWLYASEGSFEAGTEIGARVRDKVRQHVSPIPMMRLGPKGVAYLPYPVQDCVTQSYQQATQAGREETNNWLGRYGRLVLIGKSVFDGTRPTVRSPTIQKRFEPRASHLTRV